MRNFTATLIKQTVCIPTALIVRKFAIALLFIYKSVHLIKLRSAGFASAFSGATQYWTDFSFLLLS